MALLLVCAGFFTYRAIRSENLKHELIAAIKANDTPLALKLLDEGADPNATDDNPDDEQKPSWMGTRQSLIKRVFPTGRQKMADRNPSALLVAVNMQDPTSNGIPEDTTLVQALLEHGAAIDCQDKFGNTPLIRAASQICPKTVRILLENGADPNHKDISGGTAIRITDEEIAKLLIQHGADPNALDRDGYTPLCWNCMLGEELGGGEMAQTLIRSGVDVNVRDASGKTPLMYASRECSMGTIKMLLDHGADVHVKDSTGTDALLIAAAAGRSDLVTLYLDRGMEGELKTPYGSKVLAAAASLNHRDVVKILLQRGADFNAR